MQAHALAQMRTHIMHMHAKIDGAWAMVHGSGHHAARDEEEMQDAKMAWDKST